MAAPFLSPAPPYRRNTLSVLRPCQLAGPGTCPPGTTRIPFALPLRPPAENPSTPLYETYHGINVNVQVRRECEEWREPFPPRLPSLPVRDPLHTRQRGSHACPDVSPRDRTFSRSTASLRSATDHSCGEGSCQRRARRTPLAVIRISGLHMAFALRPPGKPHRRVLRRRVSGF